MAQPFIPTLVILLIFACIVTSLGFGLYYLVSGKGKEKSTAQALTVRIALSVALFLGLVLAFLRGWIQPHNLNTLSLSQNIDKNKQK